ncbi:hypothetical protein V6N13_036631 [Hibiscus sabdariffa]
MSTIFYDLAMLLIYAFGVVDTNASDGLAMTDAGCPTDTIPSSVTQQIYDEQRAAVDVVPAPEANVDAGQETSSPEMCTNGQEVTGDIDTT